MLPNVLFFILKDPNGRAAVTNNHLWLDFIEHGSQGIFAALLMFLVSRKEASMYLWIYGFRISIFTDLLWAMGSLFHNWC